jgi:hypothetical protein
MNNPNDSIGNLTHDLLAYSAVSQSNAPPRARIRVIHPNIFGFTTKLKNSEVYVLSFFTSEVRTRIQYDVWCHAGLSGSKNEQTIPCPESCSSSL